MTSSSTQTVTEHISQICVVLNKLLENGLYVKLDEYEYVKLDEYKFLAFVFDIKRSGDGPK